MGSGHFSDPLRQERKRGLGENALNGSCASVLSAAAMPVFNQHNGLYGLTRSQLPIAGQITHPDASADPL